MNSRYYNPEWVRCINADTIIGKTGALLTHNMFAYCLNNPVNHSDPNEDWVVDVIFAIQDVAEAISNPSISSVGWVLLDVICLIDPTDISSSAAHALKTAREAEGILKVVEGGRTLVRDFKMNHMAGSYTIHFKSEMQYHGEGSLARAKESYRQKIRKNPNEELSYIHWTPAKNKESGFIQEEIRLSNHGGPENPMNYNIINSPGKRYLKY